MAIDRNDELLSMIVRRLERTNDLLGQVVDRFPPPVNRVAIREPQPEQPPAQDNETEADPVGSASVVPASPSTPARRRHTKRAVNAATREET